MLDSPNKLVSLSMRPRKRDVLRLCGVLLLFLATLLGVIHFGMKYSRLPPVINNGTYTTMTKYWIINIDKLSRKYPPTDYSECVGKSGQDFWKCPKINFLCPGKHLERTGRANTDDGMWTCGLNRLGWLTQKTKYSCKVYIFGQSAETSFERKILLRTACAVFVYDPYIDGLDEPLSDNPRVVWKKIGIDGDDGWSMSGYMSLAAGTQLSSLRTIMEGNRHYWIDILKIDVEGSEFPSLERILDDFVELPVGQLLVEIHSPSFNADWAKLITLFKRLETKGMRLFHVEPSSVDNYNVAEFSFVNLHTIDLFIKRRAE